MANFARSMKVSALVLASVIALTSGARADDRVGGERCAAVRDRLALEHARAQKWRYGWAIGFGLAAIAQGVGAPFVSDRAQRDVLYTGAVKAGIGTLARLVLPVRVPDATADEPCDQVMRDLAEGGRSERNGFWLNHVGGFLVNLGGAVALAHYTNWRTGLVSFAIGYPVGLASTYTMPRWAWHPILMPTDTGVQTVGLATTF